MAEGIIFKALSGFYYVESQGETVECKARGRFRADKTTPLVGDNVTFTPTEPGRGLITEVLPRKNSFIRPALANLDQMVIIASGAIPVTDPFLIDRMTAILSKNNCECVICINKSDLTAADELYEIYSKSGFQAIRTSAKTHEGIEELSNAIAGKVSAFTGNSGVGKSSILNVLDPEFQIYVSEVSRKLGRGRHTTRHIELYKLKNGAIVADTPGFSSFDTERMDLVRKEELQYVFCDFAPYLGDCRFLDCSHIKEPGCAVLEALSHGKLQKTRHESYVRLYEQVSSYKSWEHKQD